MKRPARVIVTLPRARLCEGTAERLEVDVTLVEAAVERLGRDGEVVLVPTDDGTAVFEASLWRAEGKAATELLRLAEAPSAMPIAEARSRRPSRPTSGIPGSRWPPSRSEALRQVLRAPVVVITGGPGVGKTTIVRGIVQHPEQAPVCRSPWPPPPAGPPSA